MLRPTPQPLRVGVNNIAISFLHYATLHTFQTKAVGVPFLSTKLIDINRSKMIQ